MTLELRPFGITCNIQCQYCYQHPQRDTGHTRQRYDLVKMQAAAADFGGSFTLFGGEPLLLPLPDLEALWAWGYAEHGRNGIQTNGTLITDDHIALFKKYNVGVGISIDGPGALNDARWAGTLAATRQATAKTEAAIARLCAAGIVPSLIVTLHRGNATAEKLPAMHAWFHALDDMGITSTRLHILETETPQIQAKYGLTPAENVAAFRSFNQLEQDLPHLRFDVFDDMRQLLLGQDDSVTCVWNACDPYTTRAVQGIEGDGQRTNCGRTNKDGIDMVKADVESFERNLALYHTPQAFNGCRGCRFFLMCKGQCPGTAVDGDWRNRSEHCAVWQALFTQLEAQLLMAGHTPLSVHPDRTAVEQRLVTAWTQQHFMGIVAAWEAVQADAPTPPRPNGTYHGDHTDHGDSHAPAQKAGQNGTA